MYYLAVLGRSSTFANLHRCFESAKYSDLLVQSGSREFKVHKNVVCGQSEWFEKAIKKDAFLVCRPQNQ